MTKPIERVYVCESQLEATLLTTDLADVAEFMELNLPDPTKRVFVEELPWNLNTTPNHKRRVLALYQRRGAGSATSKIIASFGSEAHWVVEDHDGATQYLNHGIVVAWQELPENPEEFR